MKNVFIKNRKLFSAIFVACLVAPLSMAVLAEDAKTREVVSFKKFKEVFPDKMGELIRNSSSGENQTLGELTYSQAVAKYAKDKDGAQPTVEVTIMDYANPQMAAGIAMFAKMNFNKETDDEWTKTTKIDGHASLVKYNSKDKDGTYTIYIADRFILTVQCNGVTEDEFKKIQEQVPVKKFAELAK